jgi:hypothetical protein
VVRPQTYVILVVLFNMHTFFYRMHYVTVHLAIVEAAEMHIFFFTVICLEKMCYQS